MKLGELIAGLDVHLRPGRAAKGAPEARICDVTEDSRTAMPGSLFIARKGAKHDGRAHIADAVGAGAVAVLVEGEPPVDAGAHGAPILTSPDAPLAMAHIAERFYGRPSERLTLIGVTGTNGKTTIAHLVHQILNGVRMRCGLVGTVTIDNGVESVPAWMTTPSSLETSRLLSVMVEAGCKAAVMEVSSHALHQRRVAALDFDVAVFTNLTGDHLDYHGTMDDYAAAKATLFEGLDPDDWAVVNAEDPWTGRLLRDCRARALACTTGAAPSAASSAAARCSTRAEREAMTHTDVRLSGPWGEVEACVPLVGRHNLMNVLQAVGAAHCAGAPDARLATALARVAPPPGRLERIAAPGVEAPFAVFVDYAHSDDSLAKALEALRPLVAGGGRLRAVFGCGGDRDRTKRPRMGAVAARLADDLVVTSDNPRTEDPSAIISQIIAGVPADVRPRVHVDAERERAIQRAIDSAGPGDIVLIAGKGHEDYQILPDGRGGTVTRHFDDREVARAALHKRFAHARGAPEVVAGRRPAHRGGSAA